MRITYDPTADALYISFVETTVTMEHVGEGIAINYASDGRVAGIEILDATLRLAASNPFDSISFERLSGDGPIIGVATSRPAASVREPDSRSYRIQSRIDRLIERFPVYLDAFDRENP